MLPKKRIALVLLTLVACVGCDQKTKSLASKDLQSSSPKSFLANTVRMEYAENQGGFLEFGASLPGHLRIAVFMIGCSVVVSVMVFYTLFVTRASILQVVAMSMICGGGIGNLIDRWSYGYVRDFLIVGVGPVRTGIFNMADAALIAGCLFMLLAYLRDVKAT